MNLPNEVDPLSSPAPETGHTLRWLAAALGKPDPSLLEAFTQGISETELVGHGKPIMAYRVLQDTMRIYSMAYDVWTGASAEQQRCLRGFSPELLAVGVTQALELQKLLDEQEQLLDDSKTSATPRSRTSEEKALKTALLLREQALDVLGQVAGRDPVLSAQLQELAQTGPSASALANTLEQLAHLGAEVLGHKKDEVARRIKMSRLDEAYLTELRHAAQDLRSSAAALEERCSDRKTTLKALDRADTINLLLLGQVIRAFDTAHDLDPSIPRLVPISTRRFYAAALARRRQSAESLPPPSRRR